MKKENAFEIAQNYIRNGYFNEGEKKLVENINNNSFPLLSKIELSKLLGNMGKAEEGISLLKKLIERPKNNPLIYKTIGALEELSGNGEIAKDHYSRAIELDKGQPLWVYYGAKKTRCDLIMDEANKLLFSPMPKCASSSVKSFLLKHTENVDSINPHAFYANPFFNTKDFDHNQYKDFYRFTIVRDPVDRFLSYYNKNIMQENSLTNKKYGNNRYVFGLDTKPEINFLVENFHRYAFVFDDFRHHTLPQSAYLTEIFDILDDVYTLDTLNVMNKKLCEIFGLNSSKIPHLMKSSRTIDNLYPRISLKSLEKLFVLYQQDYGLLSNYFDKERVIENYFRTINSFRNYIGN